MRPQSLVIMLGQLREMIVKRRVVVKVQVVQKENRSTEELRPLVQLRKEETRSPPVQHLGLVKVPQVIPNIQVLEDGLLAHSKGK